MKPEEKSSAAGESPPDGPRAEVTIAPADHASAEDRAVVQAMLGEHLAAAPGESSAARRYEWLYLRNPHGKAATFVARDAHTGEPAGLTSLFPRRVLCDGDERVGAIGGDGFVRPAFRRRGIATQLHRAALAGMPRAGIDFMYGPPEPNNLKALLHSGSTIVGDVQRFTRVLGVRRLGRGFPAALARRILRPPRSRLELEPLSNRVDPRVDEVFRDAAFGGDFDFRVLPVRDGAFYAWRFGDAPAGLERPYVVLDGRRPVGLVALERTGHRTGIVDLFCRPGWRRAVLAAVLNVCKDDEAVLFECHVPAKRLEGALYWRAFAPRERKAFQVQVSPDHPLRPLLLDPAAWMYQWGDGDVDQVI